MKKMIYIVLGIAISGCLIIFCFLYANQEKWIFFPQQLSTDFKFDFEGEFREMSIATNDNKHLNAVLFKADSSKGLIFYLHGNAGSLKDWGGIANTYTALNYDLFILDYRGYGKSEGSITGQKQLFDDIQIAYDSVRKMYPESRIVVLGYSIGTGPAAKLASCNHPRLLILQAPYYNLLDMMKRHYPIIPAFILKYKFETNNYLRDCTMPVVIFHGDQDEVIYYESSVKLQAHFKKGDTLITLYGQRHNGITENVHYQKQLMRILNE